MTANATQRPACANCNARGRAATFLCGISVTFELRIVQGIVEEVGFRAGGCGYVIAAAEIIAEQIAGVALSKLRALAVIESELHSRIGPIPAERAHCVNICLDGMQNALADYRTKQIAAWNGDEALICSCFGVAESDIESVISSGGLTTVEEVGEKCNAGIGCGSCQPMIQEILDGDF